MLYLFLNDVIRNILKDNIGFAKSTNVKIGTLEDLGNVETGNVLKNYIFHYMKCQKVCNIV